VTLEPKFQERYTGWITNNIRDRAHDGIRGQFDFPNPLTGDILFPGNAEHLLMVGCRTQVLALPLVRGTFLGDA